MTNNLHPSDLKLYPLVGIKSFKTPEAAGAWRLFVLAKNLAGAADHIQREDLKQAAFDLGVSKRQYHRWINAARNYDFFTDVQRMSGEWILILTSNKKAAARLGCETQGRPVVLPAKLLFGDDWRAYVFAGWQSAHTNNGLRLTSQKKQAEITGIDPQTQRKFNKRAGVTKEKNYAISNIHANGYDCVFEFGNRAALFEYWNKETHQKYLGWRLPDSRKFPLYGSDGSCRTPRTMSLFNHTAEAERDNRDREENGLIETYTYSRKSGKGNNLWNHHPISKGDKI